MWSEESLTGRASRALRKDLQNVSSDMVGFRNVVLFELAVFVGELEVSCCCVCEVASGAMTLAEMRDQTGVRSR
jgi:hypothetical protein